MSEAENLRPVVPEGTYLARSKGSDGVYRALLFEEGTGKLLGPPELVERDEDESIAFRTDEPDVSRETRDTEIREATAALLTLLGFAVVAAPHAKRIWNEKARPAIASVRSAIAGRLDARGRVPATDATGKNSPPPSRGRGLTTRGPMMA